MGMRGPDTTVIGLENRLKTQYSLNCHVIFKNFRIPDFLHVFCQQVKSYLTIFNLTPLAALHYGDPAIKKYS